MHTLSRAALIAALSLTAIPAFAQTPVAPATCMDLGQNLTVGSRDTAMAKDVTKLQAYLRGVGLLTAPATGYFGPLTRQAVVAFQKKEGLNAQGFVGPLTRERLTTRSCPATFAFMAVETPKKVSVGEEGKWTLALTSGTTTDIRVHAVWGDEQGPLVFSPVSTIATPNRIVYVDFAHAYAKAGTYLVTFEASTASSTPVVVRSHVVVE